EADDFAAADVERDVLERPEIGGRPVEALASGEPADEPRGAGGNPLPDRAVVRGARADVVQLAEPAHAERDVRGHRRTSLPSGGSKSGPRPAPPRAPRTTRAPSTRARASRGASSGSPRPRWP